MIPYLEETSKEKSLRIYITYWLMHSMFFADDNIYRKKKKECLKDWNKKTYERAESKALTSYNMLEFQKQRGISSPFIR